MDEIEDGQTVASETQDGRFVLKPVNDSSDRLYTYGARVVRVVDGDTLLVKIDLGSHMQSTQRLRLRGINTPELSTQAGVQAKAFVTEQLGLSPLIVLATSRPDNEGRNVADVWYLAGCDDGARILVDGVYLNQQLVDEGLAERFVG